MIDPKRLALDHLEGVTVGTRTNVELSEDPVPVGQIGYSISINLRVANVVVSTDVVTENTPLTFPPCMTGSVAPGVYEKLVELGLNDMNRSIEELDDGEE